MITLVDSGADMNCIQEGIIPTQYYEKTGEQLYFANNSEPEMKYKLENVHICQNKYCFRTKFIRVQNLTQSIILEIPFISLL